MFLHSYQDYYYIHYTTRGFSCAHLLCLFTAYLIIALPFYFAFGDFWLDNHNQPMNTSYNYTGYYAVQVNYQNSSASSAFGTHQFSNIPGNGISSPTASSLSLQMSDQQNYGSATITLSGYSGVQILSTNIILYYQVYFAQIDKSILTGVMWNAAGNIISGSAVINMQFMSSTAISQTLSNSMVNLPPFYPNLVGGFTFNNLADELLTSGSILMSRSHQQLITDSGGSLATRTLNLSLTKKRSVIVNYVPSLLQTLKFKYSRYLAFAIISYFVFMTLLKLYAKEGLIDCQSQTERVL